MDIVEGVVLSEQRRKEKDENGCWSMHSKATLNAVTSSISDEHAVEPWKRGSQGQRRLSHMLHEVCIRGRPKPHESPIQPIPGGTDG